MSRAAVGWYRVVIRLGAGVGPTVVAALFISGDKMPTGKPILMQPDMVRAILDGRKTQTRRICKEAARSIPQYDVTDGKLYVDNAPWQEVPCSYGKPGALLWVREMFRRYDGEHDPGPGMSIGYAADDYPHHKAPGIQWRPSIHMPRKLSRLTLRITDVRVERVQDISDSDCLAEGVERHQRPHRLMFRELWDSINAKRGYSWESNPWVWVIEFKPIHANIDEVVK